MLKWDSRIGAAWHSKGESVGILKEDLKRVVREGLRREMRRLFMELIPYVSDEEMKDFRED